MIKHNELPKTDDAPLPVKYEAARFALAECDRVDECHEWADKMVALASYGRQSKDREMERLANRIRGRAIRRCGELFKEVEKANGARTDIQPSRDAPTRLTRAKVAKEAGISKDQMVSAIRVANIPEREFEAMIESKEPPTVTELAEMGKAKRSEPIHERLGMSKEAFQAGTQFMGAVRNFLYAVEDLDPQMVADGLTDSEREELQEKFKLVGGILDGVARRMR